MLRIRLSMGGVRKRPVYKIVIADSRYPRDGKFIEKIGSYNPLLPKDKKERIKVEAERVKYWMSKGAQPTMRVSRLLGEVQLMPMPKPGNNPQKAIPKKDRKKVEGDKKEEILNLEESNSFFTLVEKWLERIPFLNMEEFDFTTKYEAAVNEMLEKEIASISTSSLPRNPPSTYFNLYMYEFCSACYDL